MLYEQVLYCAMLPLKAPFDKVEGSSRAQQVAREQEVLRRVRAALSVPSQIHDRVFIVVLKNNNYHVRYELLSVMYVCMRVHCHCA
jgi:hypothetical protein